MPKKGDIGYCPASVLGMADGHYIYIQNYDKKTGLCDVNTVTSLERGKGQYLEKKIAQVRKGNTCPIAYFDANFKEWSGVTHNTIKGIKVSDIKNVGLKQISKKQKSILDKFLKK